MSLAGCQTEQHTSFQTQIYQRPATDDEDLEMTDMAEYDTISSDEDSDEDEEEVDGLWETTNENKNDVNKPIEMDTMDFEEETPAPKAIPMENEISKKNIQAEKEQPQKLDRNYEDSIPQICTQDDEGLPQDNVHEEEDQISEIDYQVPESEYGDDELFVRGATEHSREEEYSSEQTLTSGGPARESSIQAHWPTQDPKIGEEGQARESNHKMVGIWESKEPNDVCGTQNIDEPTTLRPISPVDAMTFDEAVMPTQSSDHCMRSNPAPVAGPPPIGKFR
jgi:hypothetical protein